MVGAARLFDQLVDIVEFLALHSRIDIARHAQIKNHRMPLAPDQIIFRLTRANDQIKRLPMIQNTPVIHPQSLHPDRRRITRTEEKLIQSFMHQKGGKTAIDFRVAHQ